MIYLVSALSGIVSVYMLLICVRILLTWFSGAEFGGLMIFLRTICDPYLDWWRRFRVLRRGPLDFSPLAGLAALSLLRGILGAWSIRGGLSIALILVMLINAVWSVVSWILGFCVIILILRLVAYFGNLNIYSPFWHFVDLAAQPVMYRICRILFPGRIISYTARIIISIIALFLAGAALWVLTTFITYLLRMPPV